MSFIRPFPNSTFNCHSPKGKKFLSRLRLGLINLENISSNTVFRILSNPHAVVEKVKLSSPLFQLFFRTIGSFIRNTDTSILQHSDSKFTSVLLIGDTSFDNNKILLFVRPYGIYNLTGRFDEPLFNSSGVSKTWIL